MAPSDDIPKSQTPSDASTRPNGIDNGLIEPESTEAGESSAESAQAAAAGTERDMRKRIRIIEVTTPVTIAIIGGVRPPAPRADS